MKLCANTLCSKPIPATITIQGKRRNLCNRKFCLDCSPLFQHNTRDITKPLVSRQALTYQYVKKFRHNKKQKAVELLGGKCVICGYDKSFLVLEFHHTDPKEKDFNISEKSAWGFERLKPELKKCVLLCPTCHREVHVGIATLPILNSNPSDTSNKETDCQPHST